MVNAAENYLHNQKHGWATIHPLTKNNIKNLERKNNELTKHKKTIKEKLHVSLFEKIKKFSELFFGSR